MSSVGKEIFIKVQHHKSAMVPHKYASNSHNSSNTEFYGYSDKSSLPASSISAKSDKYKSTL